jgi:hypothetical protein
MTSAPSSEFSHVIDYTEAMEQCGDDEEFLRELLSDLRGEVDAQIIKIDEVLKVREGVCVGSCSCCDCSGGAMGGRRHEMCSSRTSVGSV